VNITVAVQSKMRFLLKHYINLTKASTVFRSIYFPVLQSLKDGDTLRLKFILIFISEFVSSRYRLQKFTTHWI
jgi:hypothetical protein